MAEPEIVAQRRHHAFRRVAVVRAVDDHVRAALQHLEPPRPRHVREPCAHMLWRQLEARTARERLARQDRRGRVIELMPAGERQSRRVRRMLGLHLEVLAFRGRRRARQLA